MKKPSKLQKNPANQRVSSPWQLQTAKAKFSELFRLARSQGPQLITRQGKEGVIMLPVEQYEQLVSSNRQPIVEFFRTSPMFGVELDFEREQDTERDVDI